WVVGPNYRVEIVGAVVETAYWSDGTSERPHIKAAINRAVQQIQATKPDAKRCELTLAVGTETAAAMNRSVEIRNYVAGTPPSHLAGWKTLVIEMLPPRGAWVIGPAVALSTPAVMP